MPKLTDLIAARKTISVPFGESALKVSYRPNVVTPRLQKAISQAQREQDIDAGLLAPMSELIHSWDLTSDSGETIETTREALADVPAQVLLAVINAIGEDMAPNRERDSVSVNGSSAMASSAVSRNGTPS